ncbi:MAG TPA: serine hydrolase domain-containing protein [Rhizomicrobium sp.]
MRDTTKPTAWLAPALAYIQTWLAFQMRVSEQVGCALAISHRGRIVLDTAFGHADLLAGEALTSQHRFRVASHSKSFTAAAVMKLREQGKLKLDDPAGKYVSGLHPAIAAATISQLLSHTAGIFRDGEDSPYWQGRAPFSDAAKLRRDLKYPPTIDANTRLKYSNHGFALAGLVIEAVAGEPYASYVAREIVAPAGLSHTTPDVPLPKGARLASGHRGKTLLGKRVVFPGDQSTHALTAATGFVSTAADLCRFFGQLDPKAKTSVLSPASRREMTRPQWRDAYSAIDTGYGLGIITGAFAGWDWFGHSGGFQGYLTRTSVVPAHGLTVSLLTNAADGVPALWSDGVLHILSTFQKNGAPDPRTRDWSGRWWSLWGATDLVPMGDKVLCAMPGLATPFLKVTELAVTAKDEARIAQAGAFGNYGEPARLVRAKGGKPREVRLASGRLVPEAALRKELLARYGR